MRDILFKNITLKILSLFFAVILWLFVVGERGTEIGFLIPLELKDIPTGFMVSNEVKNLVEVRVSGPRTLLTSLSPSQMRIALDLSKSEKGTNLFQILPEDISVPRGINVTAVKPSSVTIELEKVITIEVPVKVRMSGSPLKGYKLGDIIVNPSVVTLTGAEGDLKGLKAVSTVPIDIKGISESVVKKAPLELKGLKVAKMQPDTVEISITIDKR